VKILGLRLIPIHRIVVDGSFAKRLSEPRVVELAASIEAYACIHEPIVRKSDWRLIAGRDRLAAHIKLERKSLLVKLVECTDAEALDIEAEENLQRRHDPVEEQRLFEHQRTRFVERARKIIEHRKESGEEKFAREPRTANGLARRQLASAMGIKVESVRKREYRIRQRDPLKTPKFDFLPPEPTIDTLGVELEQNFIEQVREIQDGLDEMARGLARTLQRLSTMETRNLPLPAGAVVRLKEHLKEVGAKVRGFVPDSLCPVCKGESGQQEHCIKCMKSGWISREQVKAQAAE
jgi:hypothetical protein